MLRQRSYRIAWLLSAFCIFASVNAADDSLEFDGQTYELDAFVIYETPIEVIDGMTGEKYIGSNPVVLDFADTFNDLLLALDGEGEVHSSPLTYRAILQD